MIDYDLMRLKSYMSSLHSRILYFSVDQEPFKKGGSTSGTNRRKALVQAFSDSLAEEMGRKKISKMRANVAIDFYFSSSEKTHPDHTSLIKNYIDIIRDVLLDDDFQVSVIESYHSRPGHGGSDRMPSLRVVITPMGIYEAKHALLQRYTDPNERAISQRFSNEDDSPDELVEMYEHVLSRAKDEKSKAEIGSMIERIKEERAFSYFWPYDFPFNFSSKLWGDFGLNAMFAQWRSEQRGITIALPYTAESIVEATAQFLAARKLQSFTAHSALDVNIEVVNWDTPGVSKDIDNIFIDIKKAYFNAGICRVPFSGVRIYRYSDKLNPASRMRIKFLPPLEIFFHIHGIEDQAEEKFRELSEGRY